MTNAQVANCIRNIGESTGRNAKEELLRRYSTYHEVTEVLEFLYNPYKRTGIGRAKLINARHGANLREEATFSDIIKHLTINQTGNAASVYYAWQLINSMEPGVQWLAVALVIKTLKIGVTSTTLNKVYGKHFIPKIGCMLAHKYEDKKSSITGPFIVTEKLDGIRRILVKNNGVVRMYSRSGIEDDGLVEIMQEALDLPDGMVYDGELLAEGEFTDCIALRQATNSIANRKGVRTGVAFHVFDMIPFNEFVTGTSTMPCNQRKVLLANWLGDRETCVKLNAGMFNSPLVSTQHILPVPVLGITNVEPTAAEIEAFAQPIWDRKGEGIMLNTIGGKYELKRSNNILKVKACESHDLPIIAFQEGTGRNAGALGAVIVKYKGNCVGVGSGFSDAERRAIWDNQADFLGSIIEIDCHGESTNAQGGVSLNCPIFKGFRYDKGGDKS